MKRLWLVAPLLAGVAVTPAYADPLGFTARAELRAGYDEVRPKITVLDESFTQHFGGHGVDYGAEIGVDARIIGPISLGAYAGIDASSVKRCQDDTITEFGVGGDSACVKAGTGYTAGLRAGFDPGGGLIYIKGGYSHAKIHVTETCFAAICGADPDPVELLETRGGVSGWHIGAGVELDVTRSFYVKGEYVHHQYKKMHSILADAFPTDKANITREQVLFGVGMRFGASAPPPPVVVAPPPPVVAPATQTCPDGSVIDATATCPVPPPPPPPPPAPTERGERG